MFDKDKNNENFQANILNCIDDVRFFLDIFLLF